MEICTALIAFSCFPCYLLLDAGRLWQVGELEISFSAGESVFKSL
jgi:hypothetical protein